MRLSVTDWEVGGSAWAQPTPVVVKVAMVLGAALMIVQMISNIRGDLKSLRMQRPEPWVSRASRCCCSATFVLLIIILGMPIAFATGLIAVVFCAAFADLDSLAIVTFRTYGFVNSYVLLSVPMFLMMASILDKSGVAHDLYDALKIWAGRVPGGVGVMTLIAASVMAAMTGIIGGEVILLGLVALPQMLRLRYDSKLAIGVVCAGGSLGTMIPPSLVLVFYGLTTSSSIGDLFVASTIPGVMLAVIYIVVRIDPLRRSTRSSGRPPRRNFATSR